MASAMKLGRRQNAVDLLLYGPYSSLMPRTQKKGVEEARTQLPSLLSDAEKGIVTIITRHGRDIAAIVPLKHLRSGTPRSLLTLEGTGKGLWGRESSATLKKFRDEWNR